MSEPRLIRKYANRRLYDSTDSRHVTLEDIRKLVAAGIHVKVVDDSSGEDLTRPVLLQIIAEQEQFGQPVLSMSCSRESSASTATRCRKCSRATSSRASAACCASSRPCRPR